ncbi:MAG: hypothetical protein COW02_13015 [Comamonadaceae bacterium CG12_big_fil_rev_8_21_14_0_65_59_15]|nr:MAG: hypothetical protein COW02_13015 [Comamonadaceae bacterium CG12_big_fil_rev_8_21_14_0_65_59_15]
MARLTAVSSATPSLQAALMRSRVEQARREASQAQAYADDLRQQLDRQEQITQQAQGRVRSMESGANTRPVATSERVSQTSASQTATVPSVGEPTYLNTLAAVFKVAQPILAMDLSNQQKDLVNSSLLTATNTRWSDQTAATTLSRNYTPQTTGAAQPLTTGRLLNQVV